MDALAEPEWKEAQNIDGLIITRCEAVPLRLMGERAMFEPSAHESRPEGAAKDLCFTLSSGAVRAYLEKQEDRLDFVKSCLAKPGLVKCKLDLKRVRVFDEKKQLCGPPAEWTKWTMNVLVQYIGTWQNSDACGLSLYVSDVQLLKPYEPSCPF